MTSHQPNILIDNDGHARLTDFGFASVVRGLHSVLVTSVQGYTARWAAPEVLETGDKNTRAADVFAFAMVGQRSVPGLLQVTLVFGVARFMVRLTENPLQGLYRKLSVQRTLRPSHRFEDYGW